MSAHGQPSKGVIAVILVCLLSSLVYFTTGFFVIQPIGALPEGATIWCWRFGTSLPFISSADGLLLEKQGGVSLQRRAVAFAAVAKPIADRKIATFAIQ